MKTRIGFMILALNLFSLSGWSSGHEAVKCDIPHAPKGGITLSLIPAASGFDFEIQDHSSGISHPAPIRAAQVKTEPGANGTCHLVVRGRQGNRDVTASISYPTQNGELKNIRSIVHLGLGEYPPFECTFSPEYQELVSGCSVPASASRLSESSDQLMTCDSTETGKGRFHFTVLTDDSAKKLGVHLEFYKRDGYVVDRGTRSVRISGKGGSNCKFEIKEVESEHGDKFAGQFFENDFSNGQGHLHLNAGATSKNKWDENFLDYTCTLGAAWPSHVSDCHFNWPSPSSGSSVPEGVSK